MKVERSSEIIMAIAAVMLVSMAPSIVSGASSQSYNFIAASPSVSGHNYSFPLYLEETNTTSLANLSITREIASNLSLELADQKAINLRYAISNLTAGYFVISFSLDVQEISEMKNGSFILVASSLVQGNVTYEASGVIKGSLFPAAPQTWYEKYLGFRSAPPGTFTGDIAWVFLSLPALSSYGVLGTLIAIYYLNKIRIDLRDGRKNQEKEEREEKRGQMIEDIHDKVNKMFEKVMDE